MKTNFFDIAINGIATALPKNKLELASLGKLFGDNEVKRIMASTGIQSVRVAEDVNTSDLCEAAARNLFAQCNVAVDSIDAIVFVSQTPDAIMPATSAMLQHRLGISINAMAFDISYGCSGYIYGLYQAALLILAGGCQRVLLCAGDVITPLLHPNDRQVRMVFGDAGSATLIEKGSDHFSFVLKTDGSGAKHLTTAKLKSHKHVVNAGINNDMHAGYLYMNGAEIMEFALREVPPCINELLDMKGWQVNEVGAFVLHQANQFMLNYLRKKMQLDKQAVPIAVENTGNTGPASIPLALSLTKDRLKEEGRLNKVVMCGFGVGLSWGATGVDLSNTKIMAPVEI